MEEGEVGWRNYGTARGGGYERGINKLYMHVYIARALHCNKMIRGSQGWKRGGEWRNHGTSRGGEEEN